MVYIIKNILSNTTRLYIKLCFEYFICYDVFKSNILQQRKKIGLICYDYGSNKHGFHEMIMILPASAVAVLSAIAIGPAAGIAPDRPPVGRQLAAS